MKKTELLRYTAIAGLMLTFAFSTQAQSYGAGDKDKAAYYGSEDKSKLKLKIGYNISTPIGSFKDEISKTSFSGFGAALAYPINNQWDVGLGVLYNDYYQKYPRQVYTTGEGTVSAVLSNSIQTLPIMAKVDYTILKEGLVRPYVGLGAGGNLVNYKQYLGEFPYSKSLFKPAFSGDAGVNIALGRTKTAGVNLGANYNYLPFNFNGVDNLNNWGVHAGLFFTLH
ncbi:MAG: outer membrane beta-barrel protein [Williamsia sp.]|nr:outer membrane beta-barrel protein [Williamsia sp.]